MIKYTFLLPALKARFFEEALGSIPAVDIYHYGLSPI